MGKFIITEDEKKHILGLYEQTQKDIFLSKGFEIVNPKGGKYEEYILRLKNKYGFEDGNTYQRKKDNVMLVSDGKQVIFLTAPNGMIVNQVYTIEDIQNKL
jgi:hypothetical protein